jgi:hypothetical protein
MTNEPVAPTLRELFGAISCDAQSLCSQTLKLARVEISLATSRLAWSAAGILAGVFVATAGAGVMVSALVLICIALGLPAWAAALSVGTVLTLGGALAARLCLDNARRLDLRLGETHTSLRETLEWLKLQTGN